MPLGRHSLHGQCGWHPQSRRRDPTWLPVHWLHRRQKWLHGKTLCCPGHVTKRLALAGTSATPVDRLIASAFGATAALDPVWPLPRQGLGVWSAGARLQAHQEVPLPRSLVLTRAPHIPPSAARQSHREVPLAATVLLPHRFTGAALCLGWTMRGRWLWCPEWPAEACPNCPISQQWGGPRHRWGRALTQARHCCSAKGLPHRHLRQTPPCPLCPLTRRQETSLDLPRHPVQAQHPRELSLSRIGSLGSSCSRHHPCSK